MIEIEKKMCVVWFPSADNDRNILLNIWSLIQEDHEFLSVLYKNAPDLFTDEVLLKDHYKCLDVRAIILAESWPKGLPCGVEVRTIPAFHLFRFEHDYGFCTLFVELDTVRIAAALKTFVQTQEPITDAATISYLRQ